MKIGIRLRAVLAGGAVALAAIGFGSLGTSVSVHAAPPTAPGTCETTATGGVPTTGVPLDCTFTTAVNVSGTAGTGGSIQETLLNGATFTPGIFMINGVAVTLSPNGVINNPAGPGGGCTFTNTGIQLTINCNTGAAVNPIPAGTNITLSLTTPQTTGQVSMNDVEAASSGAAAGAPLNRTLTFLPAIGASVSTAPVVTCTPNGTIAVSTSTTCTVTTSTIVPGPSAALPTGGQVQIAVSSPLGGTITNCTTAVGSGFTCGVAGTGTVIVTCTAAAGCAAGPGVITLTVTSPNTGTLAFNFTVTNPVGGTTASFPGVAPVPAVIFGAAPGATGVSMQLGCASASTTTGFPANTTGVFGTNNSQALANTIIFPMSANGQLGLQSIPAGSGVAGLSVLAPLGLAYNPSFGVNLGGGVFPNGIGGVGVPAVFCDAAITDLAGGPDGIPGTVPEGAIQYQLSGSDLAVITLTNTITATVNCNTGATPIEGCIGAGITGSATVPPAPATTGTTSVVPNAANGVFVALNSGVSFSLFGAGAPTIVLTATYQENPTIGALTASATTTIPIVTPSYSMYLVTGAPTIVASGVAGSGTTVTAQLYHFATGNCVPLTNYPTGISVGGTSVPFLICGTTAQLLNVPAATAPSYLVPGAEPGLITFTTTEGYFSTTSGTTTASPGAGQSVTVQCGSVPASAPTILTPAFAIGQEFNIGTCVTASVTLLGGGNVGTATVVANYIGQITGATAQAVATVSFTPTPASASLTRGCNEVVLNAGNGLTQAQVLALASPTANVVSIWQFNNSLHAFQALYFNTAGAPTDISSIGAGSQSVFYCVSNTTSVTTGF